MSLIVYPPDFSGRNEIANATAVQYSYYYNEIGKIIIDVPINDYNAKVLVNNSIVYETDRKFSFIIKNVKIDTKNNKITANGFTTNSMLNRRIIAASAKINNVESDIYSVINANIRDLPRVSTAELKGLTERTEAALVGKELLEQFIPILDGAGLGNRMTWNYRTNQHTFEIYKGVDRTVGLDAIIFSDEQGTATNLVITDDVSEFKNVAYISSVYTREVEVESEENVKETMTIEEPVFEIVGTATGDDRYEQWFELSLSTEENESKASFIKRVRNEGAIELGKLIRKLQFSITINPIELGKVYDIGDIVTCVSKRFGVKFNARVIGIKYRRDAKSESVEAILGEPILLTVGEVDLVG